MLCVNIMKIIFIDQTKHDTHNTGEWIWETSNKTINWFDWAPGEPNDWHRQQCLVYLRYNYFGVSTYALRK